VKNFSFVNQFFKHSLIKKRIIMSTKSNSSQINLLKYVLLIPMVLGMLVYTSCSKQGGSVYTNELTLEQQVEQLKLTLNSKETLTDKEGEALMSMFSSIDKGSSFQNYRKRKMKSEGNYPDKDGNVPFGIIDQVPVFPSCKSLTTNEDRKHCMSMNVSKFVNENFNTKLGKELGLVGKQRINVIFKINKDGNVIDVKSRSPHPDLEAEAIRVINLLPNFEPGIHKGKEVIVPYSLPILFEIK